MRTVMAAWFPQGRAGLLPIAIVMIAFDCGLGARAADQASDDVGASDDVVREPSADPTSTAAASVDLRVRYAVARLRLAELDLERALAANRNSANAIGEREIERLRNHIDVMEKRLEIARTGPRTASRQAMVVAAEAAHVNAKGDLEAALRAKSRHDRSVGDFNVERLRAKLELAEIRLELCRDPDYELSLLDEMQWNIDRLTDEVIDLRHQIEAGGTNDAGQPD